MTNPTRSIHSSAPPQHGNFHKFLGLLILIIYSAAPSAAAQMSTDSSPSSGSSSSSVNPSITIVVVVLFLCFSIMLFLSVCIRYCNPNPATSGGAAAARQPLSKPGLDPKVTKSFPTFHYSDVKDFKFGEGRGTLECAVCIAEFVNDDAMRLLPKCNHVFHPDCIDAWLASHSTCPVCRADLTPSKNDLEQWTGSTQPNDLDGAENQNRSLSQSQDQIAVDVEEGGNREVQASELKKTKIVLRSHSTGHSLSHPGDDLERYTLRLPVELRREMMSPSNGNLKRTISCVIGKTIDESSRKGGGGEERSGRGRLDQRWRSDRWVLTMTPPSLSRARLVASPKVGFEGDLTAVGDFNRSFLATVRTPFECLAVKRDGVGQTSTRPLV